MNAVERVQFAAKEPYEALGYVVDALRGNKDRPSDAALANMIVAAKEAMTQTPHGTR